MCIEINDRLVCEVKTVKNKVKQLESLLKLPSSSSQMQAIYQENEDWQMRYSVKIKKLF